MRESTPPANRIIGLFPELLGIGGIQLAGRMTAVALDAIAFRRGWSQEFLSLNDPTGPGSLRAGQRTIPFRGFGRRKIRFLFAGIGAGRPIPRGSAGIVLAVHPNLAVASSWMQRMCPRLRTVVMAHGVEVWKPLALQRRRALLRANVVLAPSRDTAQKLIEVQGVSPEKIRRLPWPLNPRFLDLADASAELPCPRGSRSEAGSS